MENTEPLRPRCCRVPAICDLSPCRRLLLLRSPAVGREEAFGVGVINRFTNILSWQPLQAKPTEFRKPTMKSDAKILIKMSGQNRVKFHPQISDV